jgi:molecular chaperone DnaK (HSP70)
MNDTIAIDFGTMRTKLAYLDTQSNRVELMRLGVDERPFIPSLFFLGKDGQRLFGDDAAEYFDSDPLAFLPKPLKRELREQWVRAGNRVKATPTELLTLLFKGLRDRTSEIACFRDDAPAGVCLTVPAQYGPPDEDILKKAAHNAGFHEERIWLITEPESAAQAWLAEAGGSEDYVVVLDCGGGTLDWACLRRSEGGRFVLIPDLPPGGDTRVGGFDIDEAIFALVDEKITDDATRNELETRGCAIRDQVRTLKERHSRTGAGGKVRIGAVSVEISSEQIEGIVASRYINQALPEPLFLSRQGSGAPED